MAREERSGNGCGGSSSSTILQFVPFSSLVDDGFWHILSSLKLNKHGIDDSPIPITGFYAPCSHSRVSNYLTLLAESLPADENGQCSMPAISRGNRNRCPVPGTLYNTNTLETFHTLDKKEFAKGGSKQAKSASAACNDWHNSSLSAGCLLTVILQTPLAAVNSLLVFCPTRFEVVSEYQKRGVEFLLQAINHPTYLEDLTGLTE